MRQLERQPRRCKTDNSNSAKEYFIARHNSLAKGPSTTTAIEMPQYNQTTKQARKNLSLQRPVWSKRYCELTPGRLRIRYYYIDCIELRTTPIK